MKNKKLTGFSFIELSIVILIVGILIAGVVSASRLVGEYRLTTARNTSTSSAVSSITGLTLWLDSSASGKATNTSDAEAVDGERVKTWVDSNTQATTLVTFTQITDGAGPLYVRSGINNLPTLSVTGATDGAGTTPGCLTTPYNSVLNSSRFTAFFVFAPIVDLAAGSNFGVIFHNGPTDNSSGFALAKTPTKVSSFFNDTDSLEKTSAALAPQIMVMSRNATASSLFSNGAQVGSAATHAYVANSTTLTSIGCNGIDTAKFFNGYISEVIMYERDLKAEERKAVESYLSKKYAIKIS